jgi:hypothetical protein
VDVASDEDDEEVIKDAVSVGYVLNIKFLCDEK